MLRKVTSPVIALLLVAVASAEEPKKLPDFKLPKGWEAIESKQKLFLAAYFRAGEGKSAVAVTLTGLGGEGGGAVANVNRWRAQLGLKELDEEDALKLLTPIKVDGLPGQVLDVTGEATADKPAQRLVAVMVKNGEAT